MTGVRLLRSLRLLILNPHVFSDLCAGAALPPHERTRVKTNRSKHVHRHLEQGMIVLMVLFIVVRDPRDKERLPNLSPRKMFLVGGHTAVRNVGGMGVQARGGWRLLRPVRRNVAATL